MKNYAVFIYSDRFVIRVPVADVTHLHLDGPHRKHGHALGPRSLDVSWPGMAPMTTLIDYLDDDLGKRIIASITAGEASRWRLVVEAEKSPTWRREA